MPRKEPCEKEDPKKCKEKPPKVIKPPVCVEPVAPEYVEKVLFDPDSKDQVTRERAKCLENCHVEPIYVILKECNKRVTKKFLYTAETCHDEAIDLMEALDKCVKSKAFLQLA